MPEVITYAGLAQLEARGRAAVREAVIHADEDLLAHQQEHAPVKTGTLRASIHVESVQDDGDTVTATNSTGGEANTYAIFVHEGTRPHLIEAKDGGWLSWPGADHPVKVVHHPGTHANRFMSDPLIENIALYQQAMAGAAEAAF